MSYMTSMTSYFSLQSAMTTDTEALYVVAFGAGHASLNEHGP